MSSYKFLIFLILAVYKIGEVLCLMCKACEGDMCNAYQTNTRCEFPARQCMRLSDAYSGRVFKMGCVYPYDDMCQFRQSNEQVRCYTCDYDNCNAISSSPYGGGPETPPYSNGRYGPNIPPQRYGPNGRYGYYWNGAHKQQCVRHFFMATMLTLILNVFSLFCHLEL